MKRLLFVIPSLEVGGTTTSLASIIDNLQHLFLIDVIALTHDGNNEVSFAGKILKRDLLVHAYSCNISLAPRWLRPILFIIKIVKRLCIYLHVDLEKSLFRRYINKLDDSYDCVIGFQEGNATRFASLFKHVKKVAWVHCDYSQYMLQGQELMIYINFENIVCVSQYTASKFKDIYPSLSTRVSYIYNLIDTVRVRDLSKSHIEDFQTDKFTIVSIGRIHQVKRFEQIPIIAKKLLDMNCDFRWYIIGPNYSDQIFNRLMNSIEELSVSKYVSYLGNKYNPYSYLAQSDILVTLSYTEACPMIFNEAKVLGIPVLTTDFGSSFEFIDDGINGRIVPLDRVEYVLAELIDSKEAYKRLKIGMSRYDYDNHASIKSLCDIFN